MPIKQYIFHQLGSIPGIPGEFSAGSIVYVDEETNTIIEPPQVQEPKTEEKPSKEAKTQVKES